MSDHPQVIVVQSVTDLSRNSIRPLLPGSNKPDMGHSIRTIMAENFKVGTVLRLVPESEYQGLMTLAMAHGQRTI